MKLAADPSLFENLWRGSLLPFQCAALVKPDTAVYQADRSDAIGAASQPSGSKLPRHS